MSAKGIANILFCLDASGSMAPCFRGVREHIVDFLNEFRKQLSKTAVDGDEASLMALDLRVRRVVPQMPVNSGDLQAWPRSSVPATR